MRDRRPMEVADDLGHRFLAITSVWRPSNHLRIIFRWTRIQEIHAHSLTMLCRDLKQDDWQPVKLFTLASFRSDGTISTTDAHNPE
jgi:hypothetical protein